MAANTTRAPMLGTRNCFACSCCHKGEAKAERRAEKRRERQALRREIRKGWL